MVPDDAVTRDHGVDARLAAEKKIIRKGMEWKTRVTSPLCAPKLNRLLLLIGVTHSSFFFRREPFFSPFLRFFSSFSPLFFFFLFFLYFSICSSCFPLKILLRSTNHIIK
ncbi:hypothetical protein, unlikely [Trypanosoma brucei gambiense DAL972]|uniref:Uncharacterized protein n=1 Tax=Trypanosoma brucei gambiense (strain MHOM/CI/86/DAL972) TaxID=679716 RepID=D0A2X5_TRYB9|nr:hypothetical protein, unlikely [Trypanosoma brucei gambiense DAL972]CBH15619.1 hypothetical protein, unlikely [Trypanosoma brucei gambiense DAL972]|eukprot:XP_011777883.1 hypothetical protein, unlikely [Trypanosoma brucei gambiense DAL972]